MRTESEVWQEALRELERVLVERANRREMLQQRSEEFWWQEQELETTLVDDLRDRFQQQADRCEVLRALSEQA